MSKAKYTHRKERREMRRRISSGDYDQIMPIVPCTSKPNKKRVGPVQAINEAQGQLITQILSKDIIFATGPAGTGKTYIPAALAADALQDGSIGRIIISRPMVGVGENMGFLPGDEHEKYMPWVQPISEVFDERLGKGYHQNLVKVGNIQYRPLQMMRGSSFKDTWILLDEAQNTTPEQMKMFVTRIGDNCKMIINGDLFQSDLRDRWGNKLESGLEDCIARLSRHPSIGHIDFQVSDIVRHGLIKDILTAYSR